MPIVQCPSCDKKYKLPETAIGKTANCACGNRFKVSGGSATAVAAVSGSHPTRPARSSSSRPPRPAGSNTALAAAPVVAPPLPIQGKSTKAPPAAAVAPNDDFWEDALKEPVRVAEPVTPAKPVSYSYFEEAKEEKRQKSKRVVWGADWGKVGGGLLTFLIAGGITVGLVVTTGYLYFWPAIVAVGGLLTCFSGLIGKDGVW